MEPGKSCKGDHRGARFERIGHLPATVPSSEDGSGVLATVALDRTLSQVP